MPNSNGDFMQAQIVDLQTQLSDRNNQLSQPNLLPRTSPWSQRSPHSHAGPNTQRGPHASVTPAAHLAPPPRVHGSTAGPHPVKRKPGSSLVNPHAKRYAAARCSLSGCTRPSLKTPTPVDVRGFFWVDPAADERAARSLRTTTAAPIATATAPSEHATCIDGGVLQRPLPPVTVCTGSTHDVVLLANLMCWITVAGPW